jgi:hypothetical protein
MDNTRGNSIPVEVKFTDAERSHQLETLAVATHGSLVAVHTLGLFYHANRKNTGHAVIHGAATAYSVVSVIGHWYYRTTMK